MRTLCVLVALLACFGVVGRIDYEAELAMGELRKEYARNFRAAAMADKEEK